MQGVLIASAHADIRRSLVAILQDGRTVREAPSISECLALAAAEKFDLVFVDDVFDDGTGEDLTRRLCALGYGLEIVPVLLRRDPSFFEPFRAYGVRHCICKPFDVSEIERVIQTIEELSDLQEISLKFAERNAEQGEQTAAASSSSPMREWQLGQEVDVREISQRFRRLMAKVSRREELVASFADCMREQFDVDNVVILLPASGSPDLRIAAGDISEEVREQFFIPLNEPLVASLTRLGEPVWVHDRDTLGRPNALTASRYGERLNVQVLCPVLSRGRLLGVVGLSRFHRYENSPFLVSLLRLFLSFFSEALENTRLYEEASSAGRAFRAILDAAPVGTVGVDDEGRVTHVNPAAAELLGIPSDELEQQPIERAGSQVADVVRRALGGQDMSAPVPLSQARRMIQARASRSQNADASGVVVLLDELPGYPEDGADRTELHEQELWQSMARVMAHNFKNALVPVKTCAELLPERYESESFRRSFFEVVQDNVRRIDAWIEDLLRYAEVDSGRQEWSEVLLHECIEKAVEKVQKEFGAIAVDITRDYAPEDYVRGNADLLQQAFFALIRNAFDAVQDVAAPVVTLRTALADENVMAVIQDNGSGFGEVSEAHAFDAFSTTKISGLGLGLAYVQKVTSLHGGSVRISAPDKSGSAVEVTLPVPEKTPVKE
ncbi:MAG: PAS domain-containing protein [Candidatus Pacebacteria bacterium]|nr:PAS domain-containing protein [Candidatus Paceibacterota bacterium]